MRDKLNCPNCGAPIDGYKCSYCGTQLWDLADIEFNEIGFLRIRCNSKIILIKAIPVECETTCSAHYISASESPTPIRSLADVGYLGTEITLKFLAVEPSIMTTVNES